MSLISKDSNEQILIASMAKDFLMLDIGERIKTVSQYCDESLMSRTTVQQALLSLQYAKAIELKNRGRLGNLIVNKDANVLLQFANIFSIIGGIPSAYPKTVNKINKIIIKSFSSVLDIPVSLTHYPDPSDRFELLLENKIQFSLTSHYKANQLIADGIPIEIAYNFGPWTYLNEPVLIFKDPKNTKLTDGMRIPLNNNSPDQKHFIELMTQGLDIKFVDNSYRDHIALFMNGDVDAIFIDRHDWILPESEHPIHKPVLPDNSKELFLSGSSAVLVTHNNTPYIKTLIHQIFTDSIDTIS